MTALTINIKEHPALISNVERAAKTYGITPEALVLEIITNYFQNETRDIPRLPAKLKKLRGSLSALKNMDLTDDTKAKAILSK